MSLKKTASLLCAALLLFTATGCQKQEGTVKDPVASIDFQRPAASPHEGSGGCGSDYQHKQQKKEKRLPLSAFRLRLWFFRSVQVWDFSGAPPLFRIFPIVPPCLL